MSEMYSRQQQRRRHIKHTLDYEGARRRRSERLVTLRKARREERMAKRRKEVVGGKYDIQIMEKLKHLPDLCLQLKSNDPNQQLIATTYIRQLLSMEARPPIGEVVKAGVVPILVSFLHRNEQPQLQFEACWALTNITSGSEFECGVVLKCNAVPVLIRLLESPHEQVREQCVWAIGNVSGDSARVRDYVLKCQVLPALFHLIERRPSLTCLRTAVWTLSNLCRGKPLPDFTIVSRCIPLLAFLIHNSDVEVLTDACWALSYLTDGPNNRIQAVIEANFVKRVVELVTHHQVAVQTPALRTIGNIVTGNDEQTQVVVACNGLPALRKLLDHHKKTIKKEAVWSISNLCAGAQSQLQAVLEQQGLFAKVVSMLSTPDFEIRREATWCVTNALSTGSLKQVHGLVLNGVVPPLCEILALEDAHIVLVALDGIDALLGKGKEMMRQQQSPRNPYCFFVERAGGVEKIEDLQNHKNHDVYQKALSILEKYFEIAESTGAGAAGGGGDDEDYSFMRDIEPETYDF